MYLATGGEALDPALALARGHVPVGLLNPQAGPLAGALHGLPGDGVGGHGWMRLTAADFTGHQLPDPVSGYRASPLVGNCAAAGPKRRSEPGSTIF
ncbi:MAG: hypothetical protein LBG60_11975 [Bifidobacteriaceae bacterium]|nr:hypothetical protein [Bifidobacteriaceae bacterium]